MRLKNICLLLTILAVASVATAKPVPQDKLNHICDWFFPDRNVIVQLVGDHGEMMLFTPWTGRGFLLLSTDDCVRPVLAYSYNSYFDYANMPEHVREWLEGYEHDIAIRVAAGEEASPEVAAEWQRWLEGSPKSGGTYVDPLLTTTWAQAPYFNEWCPYDAMTHSRAIAGCVATAVGQVMKYWNHPATGMGNHTYTSQKTVNGYTYTYDSLSADFGATTYDWEHMPDTLSSLSDSVSLNAIAQLLYHIGVAVEMKYSPVASSSYMASYSNVGKVCAENALKYRFKYSQSLRTETREDYSGSQWGGLLRGELDAGQPVLYNGVDPESGGHAFVVDGYDTMGFFHVNWGWGGFSDGFYLIDSLAPGIYSFLNTNEVLIGIRPMDTDPVAGPVVIDMVTSDSTMGVVTGSGTYMAMMDTVEITALAMEGHRFVRWSSGNMHNPRSFLAIENIVDTAIFEPIHEDTMAYCGKSYAGSWRLSSTSPADWGIRLPSSSFHHHKRLTAVQLYVKYPAQYELRVYLGDSISDATLAYTQTYNLQSADSLLQWRTLVLDSALNIYNLETLWVTFHVDDCNGIYPSSYGHFTGNIDGCWYRNNSGWRTRTDNTRAWFIRAIMASLEQVHLAVTPNDISLGDITGAGYYWPGQTVTLIATPAAGCSFVEWSTGSTDNPYRFVITSDTAVIGFFERNNGIGKMDAEGLSFSLNGLELTVFNPQGRNVCLYDIQGRQLSMFNTQNSILQLPSVGVYMLKAEGLPTKRIVAIK